VGRPGSFRFKFWTFLLLLAAIAVSGPFVWMPRLGAALIRSESPAKADVAVVLAGDAYGQRILQAADLARQGYVRGIVVSGPRYYDIHECDIAIQFAVRKGYPVEWFIALPNEALSTREEATRVLEELKRRDVRSFLLITSEYHTARAGRIYSSAMRKLGGGPDMRVVAAPDKWFRPDAWWKSREGLKIFFMEWSKTVATAVGI
jgi:uncharacterized SAM-binding protein YcdF (DUF218 family)